MVVIGTYTRGERLMGLILNYSISMYICTSFKLNYYLITNILFMFHIFGMADLLIPCTLFNIIMNLQILILINLKYLSHFEYCRGYLCF